MRRTILVSAIVLATAAPAVTHDFSVGGLTIDHPWARATPAGADVGSGYFAIRNLGPEPDRLVGGQTEVARRLEFHISETTNGVVRMRRVERGIEIAPGATVTLGPGGIHAMLVGLHKPLRVGESFSASFIFERAGTVEVSFVVEGLNYSAPPLKGGAEHEGDHSKNGSGS